MISASEPRSDRALTDDIIDVALKISWIVSEIAVDVFGMVFLVRAGAALHAGSRGARAAPAEPEQLSNLDLAAELDDPIGRNAEELGRIERQIRQEDEQPVAPAK
jgi:hypothetical protein